MGVKALFAAVVLAIASTAAAQVSKATDRFGWTMDTTLALAQAYRYEIEIDGVISPTPLTHQCTAATPVECAAPIPAITPSRHEVRIRAVDLSFTTSPDFGPWSDVFTFTMRATPVKPGQIRILPPGGAEWLK